MKYLNTGDDPRCYLFMSVQIVLLQAPSHAVFQLYFWNNTHFTPSIGIYAANVLARDNDMASELAHFTYRDKIDIF